MGLVVEHPEDLADHIGTELGPSEWMTVDQDRIDAFAGATGDAHWMHVDPVRAAQTPVGKTIAHGLLTLSLLPGLTREMWSVRQRGGGFNYGLEAVRFTAPVPRDARVRARQTITNVTRHAGATHIRTHCVIELESQARPADIIVQIFDAERGWGIGVAEKRIKCDEG